MQLFAAALFVSVSAAAAQVAPQTPRPQKAIGNVMPLVTGAAGPGSAALEEPCQTRILETPPLVPPSGGTVEIRYTVPSVGGCEKPAVGASGSWLQPAEESPGVLRFTAAANDNAEPRRATVVIGSWSMLVIQAGLPVVQAASAPGRLVFGVDREGRIRTQKVRVWLENDGAGGGTLTLSSSAPWLQLLKQETRKGALQSTVSIDVSALPPGPRLEAAILATSNQAGTAPMRIPVVVERGLLR